MPDLVCALILAPGSFIADLFIDRANPNHLFLLLSRFATFLIFGGVAYGVLSIKKPTI